MSLGRDNGTGGRQRMDVGPLSSASSHFLTFSLSHFLTFSLSHFLTFSLSRLLLEVAQVRRGLVLARGHQIAVAAHEVVFLADDYVVVVLVAIVLVPHDLADAAVTLVDSPWTGQGVIDDG